VDARVARARERLPRPRVKGGVLADQCPVEIARDRLDVAREVLRELQVP
jgi:hypothetical protein